MDSRLEDREKTFFHLLRKANWMWDRTLHVVITDPLYKMLNTLTEKKVAW